MKPSELIADPAKWTQGADARRENLCPCYARSEGATMWCAEGALAKCSSGASTAIFAIQKLTGYLCRQGHLNIVRWNDAPERTHAEVVSALKACGL